MQFREETIIECKTTRNQSLPLLVCGNPTMKPINLSRFSNECNKLSCCRCFIKSALSTFSSILFKIRLHLSSIKILLNQIQHLLDMCHDMHTRFSTSCLEHMYCNALGLHNIKWHNPANCHCQGVPCTAYNDKHPPTIAKTECNQSN